MLGGCILHAFLNFTEVASLYGFFVAIIIKLPPKLLLHLELKGKKKEEEEEAGEKQNISSLGPL